MPIVEPEQGAVALLHRTAGADFKSFLDFAHKDCALHVQLSAKAFHRSLWFEAVVDLVDGACAILRGSARLAEIVRDIGRYRFDVALDGMRMIQREFAEQMEASIAKP